VFSGQDRMSGGRLPLRLVRTQCPRTSASNTWGSPPRRTGEHRVRSLTRAWINHKRSAPLIAEPFRLFGCRCERGSLDSSFDQ
jgi:hypothetical protein